MRTREFRIEEKAGKWHISVWIEGKGGKGMILPKKAKNDNITAKCPKCGAITLDYELHKKQHIEYTRKNNNGLHEE